MKVRRPCCCESALAQVVLLQLQPEAIMNDFILNSLVTRLTDHARLRMAQRGISFDAVRTVLELGRRAFVRGARVHVIGRLEVQKASKWGANLEGLNGVHVVCDPSGVVLTVYRNRDLNLRDKARRSSRRYRVA